MGWTPNDTEPALFQGAVGELDGTPFMQHDFYRLIYSAGHHHFVRDFAVLFDEPIGEACGIKVEGFEPFHEFTPTRFSTIRCDLSDIEERAIVHEEFERVKDPNWIP